MEEQTQQELLISLKAALNATWLGVSMKTTISPRALKSYCLPDESKGARNMDRFVRDAVQRVLVTALSEKKS
jgi:hypothetical protein